MLVAVCAACSASPPAVVAAVAATRTPSTVISETFSGKKEVNSGKLNMNVTANIEGTGAAAALNEPVSLKLAGPFQSRGNDALPEVDLDLSVSGGGQTFTAGALTTGDEASSATRAPTTRCPTTSSGATSARSSATRAATRSSSNSFDFAQLGINPRDWIKDPKNEGTEEVGGAETIHISADVDVAAFVDDLDDVLGRAASLGVAEPAAPAASSPDSRRSRSRRRSRTCSFDMWTGKDDKILRRIEVEFGFKLPKNLQQRRAGRRERQREDGARDRRRQRGAADQGADSDARPLSELQTSSGWGRARRPRRLVRQRLVGAAAAPPAAAPPAAARPAAARAAAPTSAPGGGQSEHRQQALPALPRLSQRGEEARRHREVRRDPRGIGTAPAGATGRRRPTARPSKGLGAACRAVLRSMNLRCPRNIQRLAPLIAVAVLALAGLFLVTRGRAAAAARGTDVNKVIDRAFSGEPLQRAVQLRRHAQCQRSRSQGTDRQRRLHHRVRERRLRRAPRGRLRSLTLDMTISGAGRAAAARRRVDRRPGLHRAQGAAYRVPAEQFRRLFAAQGSASRAAPRSLGVDPESWLVNASDEGSAGRRRGDRPRHRRRSTPQTMMTTSGARASATHSFRALRRPESSHHAVKSASVDLYTAKSDGTLRKLLPPRSRSTRRRAAVNGSLRRWSSATSTSRRRSPRPQRAAGRADLRERFRHPEQPGSNGASDARAVAPHRRRQGRRLRATSPARWRFQAHRPGLPQLRREGQDRSTRQCRRSRRCSTS